MSDQQTIGFPFLIARANDYPLEFLQMDLGTKHALKLRGANTIAELIILIGNERHPTTECEIALVCLNALAEVSGPDGTDWYGYWEARNFEFNEFYLTCSELEKLGKNTPVCTIGKQNFGNAGVMLSRAGFDTLGKLVEGLRSGIGEIPGMGAKKSTEFFEHFAALVKGLRTGEVSMDALAGKFPIDTGVISYSEDSGNPDVEYNFHQEISALGIGVLHIGTKTKALETGGYRTIGDLSAASTASLFRLPGMGRSTLLKIKHALNCLDQAQDQFGCIDWDLYCTMIDVPLLPVEKVAFDGNTFAAMVGTTIGQLGRTLHDPVLQKIISERVSKLPHQRATLDDIGSSLPTPVTRERIRQREAKLLESLAAALINDDYTHLGVHFRPEFSVYWKWAAEHFADAGDDITFATLVDGLTETWGADRAILIEHLPLITTVITGEIMSTSAFGDAIRLDPRLLALSESDRAIPLRQLQIGRAASALRRQGMTTIGELISKIRDGTISRASGTHYRTAIAHLDHVVNSLDVDHRFNLALYLENTGTQTLPSTDPATPSEFMQNLAVNISEILASNPPRMRSREIFVLRTARPIATRLTMEKTAEILDTYGPSVKREETDTLVWLNEVILEGDQALAGIALSPVFVRIWQRINEVFDEANGDAELFQRYLAETFGISEGDVDPAMPTMIAILTGYPYGRLGRYTRLAPEAVVDDVAEAKAEEDCDLDDVIEEPLIARIKLKGFRRKH